MIELLSPSNANDTCGNRNRAGVTSLTVPSALRPRVRDDSPGTQPSDRARHHQQRLPAGDGPSALPRLHGASDQREQPAQFDRGRQLALLLEGGADRRLPPRRRRTYCQDGYAPRTASAALTSTDVIRARRPPRRRSPAERQRWPAVIGSARRTARTMRPRPPPADFRG